MGEDLAAAVVLKDGGHGVRSPRSARSSSAGWRSSRFRASSSWSTRIPVGATGKVARADLEAHFASHLRPAFVAPRDAAEREMAALFGEVLGVPEIGAFDNFFALGGDSLRGFQLLSRIRAQWHVDVPILDLFKEPTVAQLAATTTRLRNDSERAELERLLSEVERTSDAEAARALKRDRHGG